MGIDSGNNLSDRPGKSVRKNPNLIPRRQYDDRRKSITELTGNIRKRIACVIDKNNSTYRVDSNLIGHVEMQGLGGAKSGSWKEFPFNLISDLKYMRSAD